MTMPTTNLHKPSPLRAALQVGGFLLGLGALAACVYLVASNDKYRQQIARLLDAPPWLLASIAGLSLATLFTTGMVFRATLRPIKLIPVLDAFAINALCTLLGNLPFKLSLIARVLIHRSRHGLPLATILSWIAGTALIILISLGPAVFATVVIKQVNATWWLCTVGGTLVIAAISVVLARQFADPDLWGHFTGALPGFLKRAAQSSFADKLHHGLNTVASPGAVAEALAWRGLDLAAQVARFWLVAQAVGADMSWAQCLIAGVTYFFIQGTSPAGALGAREAGTAGMLSQVAGADALAVVIAVSAIESATNLLAGLAGAAYLRVDRLMANRNTR